MDPQAFLQKLIIWAVPVIFAITVHEVAHGWVADKLGDPTAKMLGRLTLNPIKHIDMFGTIIVPGLLLMFGGFVFGWAKPVPVTYQNLKHPKRDMAVVAAAGPAVNILMALLWAAALRFGIAIQHSAHIPALVLIAMGQVGVLINLLLAVLNMLPLPPLDGGRVLSGLLPGRLSYHVDKIEPYGFFILIGLIMTGVLGKFLGPIITVLQQLILSIFAVA